MRRQLIGPLTVAVLILGAIFISAPRSTINAYQASTEIYGIDILALTTSATGMPEQHFPTH